MNFVWNEEIKQNIIDELNAQFGTIENTNTTENHSYADSIFSPITSNLYKPINTDTYEVPNYFETTITRARTIKEIPVHTIAFSDSFDQQKPMTFGMAYSPTSTGITPTTKTISHNDTTLCDMDTILNSSNSITFSLTPEQRGVAIAKKTNWRDILFEDVSLIKETSFAGAIKKICNIQIKF